MSAEPPEVMAAFSPIRAAVEFGIRPDLLRSFSAVLRAKAKEGKTMAKNAPRHHRRFNLTLPVWVHIGRQRNREKGAAEKLEIAEETTTANISTGGCFFYMSRKPAVGAPVFLEIEVPPLPQAPLSGKILCHGKVLRVGVQKTDRKVGVACKIHSYAINMARGR